MTATAFHSVLDKVAHAPHCGKQSLVKLDSYTACFAFAILDKKTVPAPFCYRRLTGIFPTDQKEAEYCEESKCALIQSAIAYVVYSS